MAGQPPPLRPTGIRLLRDGTFVHDGEPVLHPGLRRAFERGVRFAEPEGVFIVQVGRFRGQIEVEDTAWFVASYDPSDGFVELTDGTGERLDPASLSVDSDHALRCRVKGGRFAARFTHAGQAHLLDSLAWDGRAWRLRMGAEEVLVPGIPPP